MGDRAGYVVKGQEGRKSGYLRKQWAISENELDFKAFIEGIAELLANGEKIGSGSSALRDDLKLSPGRAMLSMVKSSGRLPFDQLKQDLPHDIRRLIEIDVSDPYSWKIRKIPVNVDNEVNRAESHIIAEVHFKKEENLDKGMQFDWIGL